MIRTPEFRSSRFRTADGASEGNEVEEEAVAGFRMPKTDALKANNYRRIHLEKLMSTLYDAYHGFEQV